MESSVSYNPDGSYHIAIYLTEDELTNMTYVLNTFSSVVKEDMGITELVEQLVSLDIAINGRPSSF